MVEPEILTQDSLKLALEDAKNSSLKVNIRFQLNQKWKTASAAINSLEADWIQLDVHENKIDCTELLKKDQPVGISFKKDHSRFLFHSKVVSCNCDNKSLSMEMPDKIEKLPRRSFIRVGAPSNLVINVIFWHRGYDDDKDFIPQENVWQGKLENLSAGGMKILIPSEKMDFFTPGQIIGLQFTPMPYEKPILLEGLVRHLEQADHHCEIGVEFLGIEAGWKGTEKRNRLLQTVDKYGKLQQPDQNQPTHED